ncbi:heat shock protein DnaJ with tetratricopeptide repeat-containing protein [Actinidia rufa]|uniref:Heat shock protein DnaJ with tetratricopeptide repeat-containing protein n=1 Tax=Actinidia rufa TaxID=165716 RepID=A0A7J0EEG1_9ERIC|nr:heat shock protein DnaJ with tetratricopeptide repeat-containing protein [Actinidia rufa]
MSPPSVDLRSPFTSQPPMQPKQPPFAPQDHNTNGGFDCSVSSPFVSRIGSEKPGRSMPRHVKTRRHIGTQQEKSISPTAQNDSGLNRFNSVSGNSNQFKNDSSGIPSVFSASIGDVMCGKLNNACFVFGANNGSLLSNLNSGKNQSSGTSEQASSDGFGRFNYGVFDFGVTKCNSEHKEPSEARGKCGADESVKFDKVGSLFGANKSSSITNSNSKKRQSNGSAQQFGADEFGKFNDLGFVFGTNKSNLVSNKNSEWRASSKNVGLEHVDELRKYNESSGKPEAGNYVGFMNDFIAKLNSVVNTTSASGTSSVSKLLDEMRKTSVGGCENIGGSDNTKDPKINSSASSNPMFVFGSNKNVPGCSTGKSVTASCRQMKNTNLKFLQSLMILVSVSLLRNHLFLGQGQDNNCTPTSVNVARSTREKDENLAAAREGANTSKALAVAVVAAALEMVSVQTQRVKKDKEGSFNSQRKRDDKSRGDEKHEKQGSTAATQEACEKWRIRGNQAYEKGYLSRAEEFYTKGINSVRNSERSGVEPLMLCYSNRAAARMSCGRMREALGGCMTAAALDPHFHKVHIRAANCHLSLGEVEDALQYFSTCLESGGGICLDRRIIIEAADGLQKAQVLKNLFQAMLEHRHTVALMLKLFLMDQNFVSRGCFGWLGNGNNAGNEAYQSGRHSEAVEHYTAVVSNSIESRPFAAICFYNRAAANHALAQIADAIADCSIAIALDGSYSKVGL